MVARGWAFFFYFSNLEISYLRVFFFLCFTFLYPFYMYVWHGRAFGGEDMKR